MNDIIYIVKGQILMVYYAIRKPRFTNLLGPGIMIFGYSQLHNMTSPVKLIMLVYGISAILFGSWLTLKK